ncbi:MAG: hypothetical protein WA921_12020 [Ahrensia sp.]
MKTLLISLATVATLLAHAAFAASTSNSAGDVRVFDPNKQALFGSTVLDLEPTAAVSGVVSDQVFTGTQLINGRDADVRYTIEGGQQTILSMIFRSSDR